MRTPGSPSHARLLELFRGWHHSVQAKLAGLANLVREERLRSMENLESLDALAVPEGGGDGALVAGGGGQARPNR